MGAAEPYLSIVVATRNDNHGGSLTRRTQIFLNSLAAQCKRHRLRAELIFVEWNPPRNRPPLAESLEWPEDREWCQVRIVRVPREVHARYDHGEALPLYQMIAKNAGIRRTRGQFILATNIDIIFSDEVMQFLASGQMTKGKMYRIDRLDAGSEVPIDGSVEQQLAYCRQNLLRVNSRESTFVLNRDGLRERFEHDIMPTGSGIWFGEGWYFPEHEQEPFRWIGEQGEIVVEARSCERELLLDLAPSPPLASCGWWLELAGENGKVLERAPLEGRSIVVFRIPAGENKYQRFFLRLAGIDPDRTSKMANDSRFLSLSVFRCEWFPGGELPAPRDVVKPIETRPAWRRLVTKLAGRHEPAWEQALQLPETEPFQELYTPARLARVRLTRPASGHFGIWLDAKWYPLETSMNSVFRWAQDGAGLLVRPPEGWPEDFRLLMAPAFGFPENTMELEIRDQAGKPIARHTIQHSGWVKIPGTGARKVSLHLVREPEPVKMKNDRRKLSFRMLDFGWGETGETSSLMGKMMPETPRPGLFLLGRGWTRRGDLWAGEPGAELVLRRSEVSAELVLNGDLVATGIGPGELGVIRLDRATELRSLAWGPPRVDPKFRPFLHLHTNACGDFTLLHRDHWFDLRGYAEFDLYSMNLDSLFCWCAYFAGIDEVLLRDPMRIYHIEHDMGSGWTPEGQTRLYGRLAARGVGWLTYPEVLQFAFAMNRVRSTVIFCGENWGLGTDELEEVIP